MLKKKLSNSILNVSQICLGTMTFGEQTNENDSFKILNYAFDKGINFLILPKFIRYIPKKKLKGKVKKF